MHHERVGTTAALLGCLAFGMAACSKEPTAPTSPGAPVASVTVTPAAASVAMTHTLQLAATLRAADSSELTGRPVTWTSNAPTQASVSSTGLVTAFEPSAGVVITATSEGKSGTATVVVVIDLAGEWNFTEQLVLYDPAGTITCADTGSYVFTQNGSDIGGTKSHIGACIGPGISRDNTLWPTSLANGQLSSSSIVFEIVAGCSYRGSVTSAPVEKLSGIYSCARATGSWEAIRGGAPVASVAVRSDVKTVVGGVVQFVSVLRDAAGHVLDRVVAWSSDNASVATVSDNGLVALAAAGSARITATSAGKSGSAAVTADVVSFSSVSAGVYHSCGVTPTGAAYCWGWGGDGQLGSGSRPPAPAPLAAAQTPVAVAGGHVFATLSAGYRHSCGVTTSNEAYCWGDNYWGELGNGSTTSSLAPVQIAAALPFAGVQVGARHSCGVTTTHAAYCWGDNAAGQLGDGSGVASSSPVAVAGGLSFDALSVGGFHSCGLESNGAAHCWGSNEEGQIGDGTTNASIKPGAVAGGHAFVALSAGLFHTCGITSSGSYCWGYDADAELGTGATSAPEVCSGRYPCSTLPVAVAGGHNFAALSAGQFHTCAVEATSGAGYCWGNSEMGQLGIGVTGHGPEFCSGQFPCSSVPLAVARGLRYVLTSAGAYHTCAVTTTQTVYCWGINADGQLGVPTTETCVFANSPTAYPCATTPLRVAGQPGAAAAVAAGVAHVRAAASVGPPTSAPQRSRPAPVARPAQMGTRSVPLKVSGTRWRP